MAIYNNTRNRLIDIQKGKKESDLFPVLKELFRSKQYNDVENIGNMFMFNYFKGINPFDYIEEYKDVTIEYAEMILKELFVKDKMVVSKVLPKK